MKKLNDLIGKLKSFENDMYNIIERVVRQNEVILTEMNSEDQLFEKGITREGISISSYAPYSPVTVQMKRIKGQPTSRVTLRDEGDFHYSFFIHYLNGGFEIKAADWKTETLIQHYGEEILGLTDYNFLDFARNYVLPEINKAFRKL